MERPKVDSDSAFMLEPQDVVLEAFADETVAVHLGTGRYFSIDLVGAEVLELLETGSHLAPIVDHMTVRYGADRQVVEDAVVVFVGQLLDEGLIRATPNAPSGATIPEPEPEPAPKAFTAPTISAYSDMEDLLLLDPIHDVDETGWPVRGEPAVNDLGAPVESE